MYQIVPQFRGRTVRSKGKRGTVSSGAYENKLTIKWLYMHCPRTHQGAPLLLKIMVRSSGKRSTAPSVLFIMRCLNCIIPPAPSPHPVPFIAMPGENLPQGTRGRWRQSLGGASSRRQSTGRPACRKARACAGHGIGSRISSLN